MPKTNHALLLMAHGGPNNIDEVESVLKSIRGSKPVSEGLLLETKRRYNLIGGKSPLLNISQELQNKLNLKIKNKNIKTYIGMLHSSPTIPEALEQIDLDYKNNKTEITAICLASFDNSMTTESYRKKLDNSKHINFISSLHKSKLFVKTQADFIKQKLNNLDNRQNTHVIFTAHSLPENILKKENPKDYYQEQFFETAKQIVQILKLEHYSCSYQSVPDNTPIKWLGPSLEEELNNLKNKNPNPKTKIIICSIGFASAHVEVLYDIDIAAKAHANKLGLDLTRTDMLNDSDLMANIILDLLNPTS